MYSFMRNSIILFKMIDTVGSKTDLMTIIGLQFTLKQNTYTTYT
jgi:hypothetical protein